MIKKGFRDRDNAKLNNDHIGAGHRKRLRDRFLQSGLGGFLDYEIIELLLTLGTPRKDCKQIAKDTIKAFGGLRRVLDASIHELQSINGIGPSNAFGIKLFQAISERYAKEKIPSKIQLGSPKEIADYCREKIGKEKKEYFMVILLDSSNNLIDIKNISVGTLNTSLVHPREVFEHAIKLLAANIILVHNHPSGELEPSMEDLQITDRLRSVGDLIGISVIDHLIISANGYLSFKKAGIF